MRCRACRRAFGALMKLQARSRSQAPTPRANAPPAPRPRRAGPLVLDVSELPRTDATGDEDSLRRRRAVARARRIRARARSHLSGHYQPGRELPQSWQPCSHWHCPRAQMRRRLRVQWVDELRTTRSIHDTPGGFDSRIVCCLALLLCWCAGGRCRWPGRPSSCSALLARHVSVFPRRESVSPLLPGMLQLSPAVS
jgi:hypothetical protein